MPCAIAKPQRAGLEIEALVTSNAGAQSQASARSTRDPWDKTSPARPETAASASHLAPVAHGKIESAHERSHEKHRCEHHPRRQPQRRAQHARAMADRAAEPRDEFQQRNREHDDEQLALGVPLPARGGRVERGQCRRFVARGEGLEGGQRGGASGATAGGRCCFFIAHEIKIPMKNPARCAALAAVRPMATLRNAT